MTTKRSRQSKDATPRETPTAPAAKTQWTRPDFAEILACAEIGAYAFRAD